MATKKNSKKTFWTVLLVIFTTILIASLCSIAYIAWSYFNGQSQYDELTEYVSIDGATGDSTASDSAPAELDAFTIDWEGLATINPDVVGWVYVPDTQINYPIVWRENDDTYYMSHNFQGSSSGGFGAEYGAIGLAGVNKSDWSDDVNYLYGHHMRNGSMFAAVAQYVDQDFFDTHRALYVITPGGTYKLDAFAVAKVSGYDDTVIIPDFKTDEEKTAYFERMMGSSLVASDTRAEDVDKAFMLYTCNEPDNTYRICLYADVVDFLPSGGKVAEGADVSDAAQQDISGSVAGRTE